MVFTLEKKEKTKSKGLAIFLAWAFQLHLLYLGRPGEFFKRTLMGITLVGVPLWACWWVHDIIAITGGSINQDAHGVPLR